LDTQIRVAQEADAEASCQVLRRSIAECCFEDHANEPSRLHPWLENKTPENLCRWISTPGSYVIVAETLGKLVGVAMMLKSGEVTLCYLVPEVRFRGVGRALLSQLESKARELGLGELRLNSTKTAHDFYLRNGFTSAGAPSTRHGIGCFPMVKALGPQ
jgi:GNAT superfamily N-acetyltransferase